MFSGKLDQKPEPEEAYNPYELARNHMKEPTVHKFLAVMSPLITSLGLFKAKWMLIHRIRHLLMPIPFLVLFPIFYRNALLKK